MYEYKVFFRVILERSGLTAQAAQRYSGLSADGDSDRNATRFDTRLANVEYSYEQAHLQGDRVNVPPPKICTRKICKRLGTAHATNSILKYYLNYFNFF